MFKIFIFILSIFCVDVYSMRLYESELSSRERKSSLEKGQRSFSYGDLSFFQIYSPEISGFLEVERLLNECPGCVHCDRIDDCFKSFFQVKVDSTTKKIDSSFETDDFIPFIVMRHFPSNSNHTGRASNANTDLQLTDEHLVLMQNVSIICKSIYLLIAPGAQMRSVTTAVTMRGKNEPIISYNEFKEQSLGELEGKSITEILRSESFHNALQDSSFAIPGGGESGNNVMRRIKLGIKDLADRAAQNLLLPMIVSSRCTMNWMLRFLLDNLQLPPVMFENGDSFVFFYSRKTESVVLLMQGDAPLILKPVDLLHLVCLPENQNIFGNYRILDEAVKKIELVGNIQKIRRKLSSGTEES